MAADLERLAREFKGDQFQDLRASLRANAEIARQLGAPEHFSSTATEAGPVTELDLAQEWQRQARGLKGPMAGFCAANA